MNANKATWKNGQIILDSHVDWPEGHRLIVLEEPRGVIEFMTEDEQSGGPAAIQGWIDEVRALPALPDNPSQEAERLAWEEKMKAFNTQAVRRQMAEGLP